MEQLEGSLIHSSIHSFFFFPTNSTEHLHEPGTLQRTGYNHEQAEDHLTLRDHSIHSSERRQMQ